MSDVETFAPAPAGKYLVDVYEDWARGESVPVVTADTIDLLAVETKPWARFGVDGAICHLDGRCDYLTLFVMQIAPGGVSAWQHHLYEEVCLVLTGHGVTEVDLGNGQTKTIEWGPKTLFAAPMNARYRHRATGGEPARLVAINDLRYLLNLYRSERFLFETPLTFAERAAAPSASDLTRPAAKPIVLADGSIGADLIEIASGDRTAARRQMFGTLLFGIDGGGMTLSWPEGSSDPQRVDWRFGVVTAPRGMLFHQHFNLGSEPARYLRVDLGSAAYPIFRPRRRAYGDTSVYASGNAEIPVGEENPAVATIWRAAVAARR